MIVLNLLCDHGHRFEGWFASGDMFRSQSERNLVHCPQCQTSVISQLPSAPYVRRAGGSEAAATEMPAAAATAVAPAVAQLHQTLAKMARQAENVGERFPEEARRIHYDEAPARTIRGVASADETRDLLDEGIFVLPAPVPPEDEFH
ncbi:MAG: DUF1178 family protein [Sulfuritalea sp.]|nr:DUF1178 family protein [Sulfuritalea sp.]MCF8183786.1 DUF1178 family protein [Polynucleobacter sp.]